MIHIIGTGLSGLVGSRVTELLHPEFQFENLSLETGIDITDEYVVREKLKQSSAPWVFHFAAMTDVDSAEKDRILGEKSTAWRVNVSGTQHIVNAAREFGKRVLYLSTDFVFDGTDGPYTEEHEPNPLSWYAMTKYEGEKCVRTLGESGLVLRIAFPYKSRQTGKPDFVHRMLEELRQGKRITAPSDLLITPTFIDDIVPVIRTLIGMNAFGIFHAVGNRAMSPYDIALCVARVFELVNSDIAPSLSTSYYINRAPRPVQAILKNDKIEALGLRMRSFEEGMDIIRSQELGM
ncbi:SDR family oxidoreductase [Candidatus Gottesmanbacteria bacterium]|nr:SDR family oxidoreductase [Candidatus Gottesmanbacteria bacterium]